MIYSIEKTKKIQSLPKLTSLQLQLNMGKIDYRNERVSIEELSLLNHKLEYFYQLINHFNMKNVITPKLNCFSNQRKVDELSKELKRQKLFLDKKYRKT